MYQSQFLDTDNITWEIEGLGEELTPLSTIFQLYRGGNQSTYLDKTTDMSHNVALSTPRHERGSNSQQ